MKSMKLLALCGVWLLWAVPTQSYAQRGTGDASGVAQQAVKPAIVSIAGTVREVVTKPCEQTTGRSYLGTHVVLLTEGGAEVNIHLGPAVRVASMAERLEVGLPVEVAAFRTDKMLENHYVAQVITADKEVLRLRDEDLRPVWAGAGGRGNGAMGAGGPGGWGRGQGRGQGWGRGGMGGRGNGSGRGMGAGWRNGGGAGGGPGFVDENHDGICDWREMTRWDQ